MYVHYAVSIHTFVFMQMLMNVVWGLTTVLLMLAVLIPMAASPVSVAMDTLEMALSVQVLTNHLSQVTLAKLKYHYSIDVSECCMDTDNCSPDATCTNTEGSFTCTCNQGYTGDGLTCTGKSISCK